MSADARRLVAAAFLIALGAGSALSAGDGKGVKQSVYPSAFPAGAGQHLADRLCVTCHSASLTTQQAKDSTGWEKTLVQMEKWGVQATPAEHDTLRRHLVATLGPKAKK